MSGGQSFHAPWHFRCHRCDEWETYAWFGFMARRRLRRHETTAHPVFAVRDGFEHAKDWPCEDTVTPDAPRFCTVHMYPWGHYDGRPAEDAGVSS